MVMHVASACRRAEAEGFSTPAQQMRKHRGRASPPRAPNTPRGEWIAICTRGVDLARPPRAAYSMDVACGCFYPFLAMGVACADHKIAVNLHSVTRRMCSTGLSKRTDLLHLGMELRVCACGCGAFVSWSSRRRGARRPGAFGVVAAWENKTCVRSRFDISPIGRRPYPVSVRPPVQHACEKPCCNTLPAFFVTELF